MRDLRLFRTLRSAAPAWVAAVLRRSQLSERGIAHQAKKTGVLRVLNYHDVEEKDLEAFEQQVQFLRHTFGFATPDDVRAALRGTLRKSLKIALTFDDGFKSHATTVAEVLERHGAIGWFFVPTSVPSIQRSDHTDWAVQHRVLPEFSTQVQAGRVEFASWDDWRSVASRGHIVGSHTDSHVRFRPDLPNSVVDEEIARSRSTIEAELGQVPNSFCWVGGEVGSYSQYAAEAIDKAGFELSFATSSQLLSASGHPQRIERTNVEATFDWDRFMLALSGIVDVRYIRKRRRLNEVFRGVGSV